VIGLPQIQQHQQHDVDDRHHHFLRNKCRLLLLKDSRGLNADGSLLDFYKILDITRDADEKAIKAAYRKMAKFYHPDINKSDGTTEQFQRVNRAYEVLTDPVLRKRYDQFGKYGVGTSAMSDEDHLIAEKKINSMPKVRDAEDKKKYIKWPVTADDLRRSDLNRRSIVM